MDQDNRVVVLIDMDCFYCQVEEKLNPELQGKPIAVVQYNPWKGGGIIAVNYIARAMGVTRHMRGDEAKEKCPEIHLPSVPCFRGKADITRYRDAGKDVAKVLQKFTPLLERASIDEAYLDITTAVQDRLKTLNPTTVTTDLIPNTFALGYNDIQEFITDIHNYGNDSIDFDHENAKRLLIGAVIVSEIRAAVYEETGYRCSAGIAHNKILAKLVCGMNKPNKQTVLPKHSVNILYKTLSLKKVKHLGGKFGDTVCEVLRISKMGELQTYSEKELQSRFDEKNGTWLYNIARGVDLEPVQARFNPKSIGCCKQLRGKSALHDLDSLRKWLKDLGDEIEDRLEKDSLENNRTPKQIVVSFTTQLPDGRDTSSSRSYNFVADDELCGDLFSSKALELVIEYAEGVKVKGEDPNRKLKGPITFLGISVGKFEDLSESKKTRKIVDYFSAGAINTTKTKDVKENKVEDKIKEKENKSDEKIEVKDKKSEINDGKKHILQRYFQSTDMKQLSSKTSKSKQEHVGEEASNTLENVDNSNVLDTKGSLESPLDKQESFFARFLKGNLKKDNPNETEVHKNANEPLEGRPTTPMCNVVKCGDDSNDTEYSGSTIDMEINKSIALFDDDPQDVARVSSIRDLLTSTHDQHEEDLPPDLIKPTTSKETEKPAKEIVETSRIIEIFECPECKKPVSVSKIEEHSDYHLALRLREEERQRVRKEIKESRERECNKRVIKEAVQVKKQPEEPKNDTKSIASFLVKLDTTVPTEMCSECGKKVAVEKFAEHLDFHEAQKLSRELNKRSTPRHFSSNSIKRKRKTISPVKKQKVPCNGRSIDSFFK